MTMAFLVHYMCLKVKVNSCFPWKKHENLT